MKRFNGKHFGGSLSIPDSQNQNSPKTCFWEIGSYTVPLKRYESSLSLVNDLLTMYEERASIEARSGKLLSDWCDKWTKHITAQIANNVDETLFYGSWHSALVSFIQSSQNMAVGYLDNWTKVQAACIEPLKCFVDENFHKNFNSIMEVNDFKDDFRTAQKPLVEVLQKYKKAKSKYNAFTETLRGKSVPIEGGDEVDVSNANPKKQKELEKLKKRYEERHKQLELVIPRYSEKMTEIFEKLDEIERRKLELIKQSLRGILDINIYQNNLKHTVSVEEQERAIKKIDIDSDLTYWSLQHGPKSPIDISIFDERKGNSRLSRAQTMNDPNLDTCPLVQESNEDLVFK